MAGISTQSNGNSCSCRQCSISICLRVIRYSFMREVYMFKTSNCSTAILLIERRRSFTLPADIRIDTALFSTVTLYIINTNSIPDQVQSYNGIQTDLNTIKGFSWSKCQCGRQLRVIKEFQNIEAIKRCSQQCLRVHRLVSIPGDHLQCPQQIQVGQST